MSATTISAALRDRLLEAGETMTLRHRMPGAIDDTTLKVPSATPVDTVFTGFRFTHRQLSQDGVTVSETQNVLSRAADFTTNLPRVGDAIFIGSEARDNEIQKVTEHVVGGTIVSYEMEI